MGHNTCTIIFERRIQYTINGVKTVFILGKQQQQQKNIVIIMQEKKKK